MMRFSWILLLATLAAVPGCRNGDPVGARDVYPPAAPRGFASVTGDQEVFLSWLDNTESDLAGYRIYESDCEGGPSCLYDPVGATSGTTYQLGGLANGATRYFAVAAYDQFGNESELSYDTVFDTPRPEGFGRVLRNYLDSPAASGYDFSAYSTRAWDHAATDIFFGANGAVYQMFVPDYQTDIQDAGYASSLDAVDYAPNGGWSPTGSVELIEGHCYVVWTRDDHYAKFRVVQIRPEQSGAPAEVVFDWAYQVDQGNRELGQKPVRSPGRRPIQWVR